MLKFHKSNFVTTLCLIIICFGCIPKEISINHNELRIKSKNGVKIHQYKDQAFSGIIYDKNTQEKLVKKYSVIEGLINGYHYTYYDNESVKEIVNYKDGVIFDLQFSFYKNGFYKEYTTYVNGKIHGVNIHFWPNNSEKAIHCYENGIKVGSSELFYPSGFLKSIGNFDNKGQKIGEWKNYDEKGKLIQVDFQ